MIPYLFVLCRDYLTRLFQARLTSSNFHYHPKCKKIGLAHLGFVDDLMVFCKADVLSLTTVKVVLTEFSSTSGLQMNVVKSSIFFDGVSDNLKVELMDILGFSKAHFLLGI